MQFGDFATAGAVNIVTKRRDKDTTFTITGASYNQQRYLGIGSPPEGSPLTSFIGVEAYHALGPVKNPENLNRFNVASKFTVFSDASSNLMFLGTAFKSYWNASGEIPSRLVRSGLLGRWDAVDNSEGGKTQRHNANLQYNFADARQSFNAQAWISYYTFDLFSNFTFSEANPFPVGDEIEQTDRRILAGTYLDYRRNYSFFGVPNETLVGFLSRSDRAHVGLFGTTRRKRTSTTSDSFIQENSIAWYAQQEVRPAAWLGTQLGLRLDKFYFDVRNDRTPADPSTGSIRGTDQGFIASPKLNVILSSFVENTWQKRSEIYLNFGGGYHSNDARDVVSSTADKPVLPRALGSELGFRTKLFDRFEIGIDYWRRHLYSELVWAGDDGPTEPGRTKCHGVEGEFRYQILEWLSAELDISYSWAKFVKSGAAVPLAPRFLAFGVFTARHASGLERRIQMRSVGDRWGDQARTATIHGYTIFDLLAKYKWNRFEFLFSISNIANKKWRAAQFFHSSQLQGNPRFPSEAAPVNDIHFTPGEPLTIKAGMTIHYGSDGNEISCD